MPRVKRMKPSKKYVETKDLINILFNRLRQPDGTPWSSADIQQATGIHFATIKSLRNGITENPGLEAVRRLSEFFKVPMAYFAATSQEEAHGIITDAVNPKPAEQRNNELDRIALRIGRLSPESRRLLETTIERFEIADRVRPTHYVEAPFVIVCDEDDASRFLLGGVLNQNRLPYVEADNAQAALQIIHTKPIDIAFIAPSMRAVSGLEIARTLREHPTNQNALLIAYAPVASVKSQAQKDELMAAGFDAIIEKPLEPDKFLSQFERIRRQNPQRRGTAPDTAR